MAAFEVQTTEIHLLLNPAQISVRAKQFQLKVNASPTDWTSPRAQA